MFERFSPLAIKTIMLAQHNVHESKREMVQPADLFVGVCALGEGLFVPLLQKNGLDKVSAKSKVLARLGVGKGTPYPELPFSHSSKRALELGWDEARILQSDPILEGHLLLGLLRAGDPDLDKVLESLAVSKDALRLEILAVMEGQNG